jgi:hypothetical protein
MKEGKEYEYGGSKYGTAKDRAGWASYGKKMKRIESKNEALRKKYPESHYENVGKVSKNATKYHSYGAGISHKEVKESLARAGKHAKYIPYNPKAKALSKAKE